MTTTNTNAIFSKISAPYQSIESINKTTGDTTTRATTATLKAVDFGGNKAEHRAYNAMTAKLAALLAAVDAADNNGNNTNNDAFTTTRNAAMTHIQGMYDYLRRNDTTLPAATIKRRDISYILTAAFVRKVDKETLKVKRFVKSASSLHAAVMDVFHSEATGTPLPTAELTLTAQTNLAKLQERERKALEAEKPIATPVKKPAVKKPVVKEQEKKAS